MSIFHEQAETHKHTQQVLAVTDNSGTGETAMHNAMVLPGSQGGGNPDRHSETCAKFNLSPACRDTCKQAMIKASDCKKHCTTIAYNYLCIYNFLLLLQMSLVYFYLSENGMGHG